MQITTTGTVTSTALYGIGISAHNTGTDLTIDAQGAVTGGNVGIYASNIGTGTTSITTTGDVTAETVDDKLVPDFLFYGDGIYSSSAITTMGTTLNIGGDVTGYGDGVDARHYGAGTLDITASATITGTGGDGIATRTDSAGLGNVGISNITLNAGAVVSGTTNAIYNDAGASNTTINGAMVVGAISLNDGSDNLTISGTPNVSGVTIFDGGDDADVADGFIDVFTLDNATITLDGSKIVNWEEINFINSTAVVTDFVAPTLNVCGGSTTLGGASVVTDVLGCVSDDEIIVTDNTQIANVIEGAGGADTISVLGNASVAGVYGGGNGQDASSAADGNDIITINTTGTVGLVDAGLGNDMVYLLAGTITTDVLGQGGNDKITLAGATVTNTIDAGTGDDTVDLTSGTASLVDGNAGADTITLNGATISGDTGGGAGADVVTLTSGTTNTASGGANNDTITLNGATVSNAVNAGAGNDTFAWTSGNLGSFTGGTGSDTALVTTSKFTGAQVLDGGDDTSTGDGFTDTLTLQGLNLTLPGANLSNWENIVVDGGTIAFSDNALSVGSNTGTGLTLTNGSLLDAGNAFTLTGNMNINAGTTFDGTGAGAGIFNISGSVVNNGIITTQDNATGDVITVGGDYIGSGQLLVDINTDAGTADQMSVSGNATGSSTTIVVNDLGGGVGAPTGTGAGNGITLVSVGGTTTAGEFNLAGGELVVGAFNYGLNLESNNIWYLQSTLLEQTNGYRILPTIFSHNIDTLHHRVGHREDRNGVIGSRDYNGQDAWVRIVGRNLDINPDDHAQFDEDRYFLQVGFDKEIRENKKGRWMLGINALSGESSTSVDSVDSLATVAISDVANIESDFYGLGLTTTWYGNNNNYADFVAQYTKYDADFTSSRSNTNIDGDNLALSAEFGKRHYPWTNRKDLSLVPQAQIIFSKTSFDSFTDADEVLVSIDDGSTLTGRLGLMLEKRKTQSSKFVGFVGVNLYLNLAGDTSINASGTTLDYAKHNGWLELVTGGTYKINKSLDLYGQLDASTSIDGFGDSNSVKGELGLRASW